MTQGQHFFGELTTVVNIILGPVMFVDGDGEGWCFMLIDREMGLKRVPSGKLGYHHDQLDRRPSFAWVIETSTLEAAGPMLG